MEVYFALNTVNGKAYVGWTQTTAAKRFRQHCATAKRGSRYVFHAALRKYGPDSFSVLTVWKGDDADEMKQVERNYIAGMKTNQRERGYNMTAGGEGMLGFVFTPESRARMSESAKGNTSALGSVRPDANVAAYGTPESCRKGGLAAKEVGSTARSLAIARENGSCRKGGLAAKANGGTARSLAIARHTRHHLNKGIVRANCPVCTEGNL
jgi:group I intron endonuclease